MGCEDEVMKIKKKLDKMTGPTGDQTLALDHLKVLKDLPINLTVSLKTVCIVYLPINLTILTETRIGMTVNALRKASQDQEVIGIAKQLIKKWKKFVPDPSSDYAYKVKIYTGQAIEGNVLNKCSSRVSASLCPCKELIRYRSPV
ncbi:Transcription factor IIS N-terminal [Trinorchestia longiramus]|nr:Transcription factor IIS N-terminal [Trinorchestia longiramus]